MAALALFPPFHFRRLGHTPVFGDENCTTSTAAGYLGVAGIITHGIDISVNLLFHYGRDVVDDGGMI